MQPIKRGTVPDVPYNEVELQVATRKENAYMGINDIVYFETDDVATAQPLFPIGAYITELKLRLEPQHLNRAETREAARKWS